MTEKKSSKKSLLIIIIIIIVLAAVVYYVFWNSYGSLLNNQIAAPASISKYHNFLKRLDKIKDAYQLKIFSDPNTYAKFLSLQPSITLPLQIGLIGKENPFESPASPSDLLLQAIQNTP
ncbi:hypothetical protein KJ840_03140 [Patescibacteria group bacterium]|nr:hypothetical protein [Patescibacteria group bacterium]